MQLKPGVSLLGMQPQLVLACMVANQIYMAQSAEMVITSVTDSKHGTGSLHYQGQALDLRINNLLDPEQVHTKIKEALGAEFDVVLEADHIHIEWQPKRGVNL